MVILIYITLCTKCSENVLWKFVRLFCCLLVLGDVFINLCKELNFAIGFLTYVSVFMGRVSLRLLKVCNI